MTEPTADQLLAHDARVRRMLADPECVGELLLVGIGMARCLDLGDPPWRDDGHMDLKTIAYAVYGRYYQSGSMLLPDQTARGDTHPRRRILSVFFQDRRRYSATVDGDCGDVWSVTCGRPMLRRKGLCGRNASYEQRRRLTDPATGRRHTVGACSQPRCRAWWRDLLARHAAELKAHPPPEPAANTGGVLERHLPELDWWKVWARVDEAWKPPPEGQQFDRPKLTLLLGDTDEPPPDAGSRPVLTVLDGGWR